MRLFVKRRVHEVDIFLIQAILRQPQAFAEALEMDDLPGAQELDGVVYIRVIAETKDVVIGQAGLLLCCNHIRTTCD